MRFGSLKPLFILNAALLGGGFLPAAQAASALEEGLHQFFSQQYSAVNQQVNVNIRSPQSQWPKCEMPQFSMPSSARRWGTVSVLAQCPQDKRYLQVEVQVTGEYPVAQSPLTRGQHISPADFKMTQGRLDKLPAGSIMEISQLDSAVLTRDLAAGQTVTASMIRRSWIIKAGQSVQILAQGDGFNVTSEGKALNNAAVADSVRVRLASGQIITGKATEQGSITLLM
uniref:flagellar basal body P-ring formation chaperone FlgA n=1 Tax=Hafnia alvei TaxID=569 RepID=UPI00242C82BE|nr:flagellar basal body P-ring formation chaperone FlgA [Hafnia alvei]